MQTATARLFTNPHEQFPVPWHQGEHVSVVGDTGTGKTTLLTSLIPARTHAVVFRTKPDNTIEPKWGRGFHHIKRAKDMDDARFDRFILTPKPTQDNQRREGAEMLQRAFKDGGWCIVLDELWYAERLGLSPLIETLLTQGRSQRITVVMGMQRPAWVSRFALAESTHLFTFRVEGRDVKTLREAFTPRIVPLLEDRQGAIGRYQFVYYNRALRVITVSDANHISQVISMPPNP